jgi:hypothetical protein
VALKSGVYLKLAWCLPIHLDQPLRFADASGGRSPAVFLERELEGMPNASIADTEGPEHSPPKIRAEDRFNIARTLGGNPATAVAQARSHPQLGIRDEIRGKFIHPACLRAHQIGFWDLLGEGCRIHYLLLVAVKKRTIVTVSSAFDHLALSR